MLCAECFVAKAAPRCEGCKGALSGHKLVVGSNAFWHPECFCCVDCDKVLDGVYADSGKHQRCVDCDARATAATCAACKGLIVGAGVEAEGKDWHASCFVCATCARPLVPVADERSSSPAAGAIMDWGAPAEAAYFHVGDRFYCAEHYADAIALTCDACSKPIVGDRIAALGKVFHPKCLVCAHCSVPILVADAAGRFVEMEGHAYCETDYFALFGGTAAAVEEYREDRWTTRSYLLHVRPEALKAFREEHSHAWPAAARELREQGLRCAQAHLFADGTLCITLLAEEGKDVARALFDAVDNNQACARWNAIVQRHLTPATPLLWWLEAGEVLGRAPWPAPPARLEAARGEETPGLAAAPAADGLSLRQLWAPMPVPPTRLERTPRG